jgi:hypothetical protein
MGMDVYGKAPTAPTGEYFRNNVWWWRPLAAYVCEGAPDITSACQYWQSNDGDGLNAAESLRLADALEAEITSGRCAEYAARHETALACTPKPVCRWCQGTGVRRDRIALEAGQHLRPIPTDDPSHPRAGQIGWCNGCDGTGHEEAPEAMYPFSVENVQEFVVFLRASGGFAIW